MEEERLAHKFDHMSMEYDSSGGLSPELVNAFIKYQPNWQATTQKRRVSFLPVSYTHLTLPTIA